MFWGKMRNKPSYPCYSRQIESLFMEKINTLIIGVGYHARRVYVPALAKSRQGCLVAGFDIESQRENIESYLHSCKISIPCYYTYNTCISDRLNEYERNILNRIIKKHSIQAVIISTEPLAHLKYIKWALRQNLHVLVDKPLTTEIGVSDCEAKAQKIFRDYEDIERTYRGKCNSGSLVFMVQAQRRFHPGFICVKEEIKKMTDRTGCPVTFLQSFHSDGQWTFPGEFLRQTYHPYNQGYGKLSHSGYHSLDADLWLASSFRPPEKKWSSFRLYTQFIRPTDVLNQFSIKDYSKLFPKVPWFKQNRNIAKQIKEVTGEVDVSSIISLMRGRDIVTTINCSMLHHSFSRRGWFDSSDKDLYKGNGRVRQESYIIEQGPFQSIIINSLQSQEIQKDELPPYSVGGEYHFDVHIFRNKSMFPHTKAYEHLGIQKLRPVADHGYSRGHQEDARRNCIESFFGAINDNVKPDLQTSNFLKHRLTTQLLSSLYLSAAKQYHGQDGIICAKIK